jgi:predicted house-cleaning noncanonical NTP pyrophosphatase (MazG superfamily)
MTVYNKLVRDNIPQIIEETGGKAEIRILSDEEYCTFLEAKLDVEVGEYHRDKTAEELADILEVVYALASAIGCSREELQAIYQKKHDARGGFEKKILLMSSEK